MPDDGSFTRAFLGEVLFRAALVSVAMALALAGAAAGRATHGAWGPFLGAVIGLLVGSTVSVRIARSRGRRQPPVATGRD